MFIEIIAIVNNLWFHKKVSWEDAEKINAYVFRHSEDEKLMKELHQKFSNFQDNMNLIPENGIRF